MRKLLLTLILISFLSCNSNIEVNDLSAGTTQKEAMLGEKLDKYNKAIYWGSQQELLSYVDPNFQRKFFQEISDRKENEDVVESKVKSINFFDSSSKATAYVETKFFNKKTLYVTSRYEKLDWEFYRLNGGWRLNNIDPLTEEHFSHLVSE